MRITKLQLQWWLQSMYITINHKINLLRLLFILFTFTTIVYSQFPPNWNTSLYIQAKTFIVVASTQKSNGTYPTAVTFSGVYPIPSLAISIPQLRLVANNNSTKFKCSYFNLTQTSFNHTLEIFDTNTVVWYLTIRYFVISLQLLPQTIQAGIYDNNPNIIYSASGKNITSTVALNFTMPSPSTSICVPFVTGIKATSPDHYQLNITCSMNTLGDAFILQSFVHPNTQITDLTVYVVIYDPTNLAVLSLYFPDYTITTTYLGTQTTFVSQPKGFFDQNFIGGLSSFSFQNNIEYNNTLSIPTSNLVYTSTSSLYNSVPQLQFRVRYCPSAYPYYNTQDGLCYTVCPSTTYAYSIGFVCYACGAYCLTCLNSTVCTTCIPMMILNTVTNGSGTTATCICPTSSYMYNGVCYGCDYTCLTCTSTGQYYNCLTCDSANHRSTKTTIYSNNFTCSCDSGYYDAGVALCQQVCGDGQAKSDPCDDSNTNNGDGCSSTCTIQENWICENKNPSTCYFVGNISIEVIGIYKLQFSNQVDFYLVVTPYLSVMDYLCRSASLVSNYSFSSVSYRTFIDPDEPDVVIFIYTGTYNQSIDDMFIRFDLKPTDPNDLSNPKVNTAFSRMPPANTTVQCISYNAFELVTFSDKSYKIASDFRYVCLIFGYMILATAPLYIFGRLKWVGNMLFLSLQFQYLNMGILNKFSPMLSGLSYFKAVMGYNELLGIHQIDIPKYPAFHALNYNMTFKNNVNFMVSFQVFALLMYIIYYIFWRRNELICKKYGGDPEKTFNSTRWGKFLSFFNWEFFMFWNIFNMTNQILGMILNSQIQQEIILIPLQMFCMICIFLALLPLFVKRKQIPSYTRLLYYKDRGTEQQMVTLGSFAIMYMLFYLARTQTMIVYYVILVVPICLIIYLFVRKPFQSRWLRAAYFINNMCIIMTLIYNRITMELEDKVQFLPFGNFIVICFDWIFNIVVWTRQAYIICKYGGEEGLQQILQSNTKTTQETNVDDTYFKQNEFQVAKNQSVLESIMKGQNKKLDNTNRRQRKKDTNPDQPQHLKRERQKIIEEDEKNEAQALKKKRQEWSKQMQEMNEIRQLRERTHQSMHGSRIYSPHQAKRSYPSTAQRGIDQSRIDSVQGSAIRYR